MTLPPGGIAREGGRGEEDNAGWILWRGERESPKINFLLRSLWGIERRRRWSGKKGQLGKLVFHGHDGISAFIPMVNIEIITNLALYFGVLHERKCFPNRFPHSLGTKVAFASFSEHVIT